jgi:hypothetical protein
MTVVTAQTGNFGANPFVVDGPIVGGTGVLGPQFKLGSVTWGESGAEWVYCKLTLASTTTLQPGLFFWWDKDYNATLGTTANTVNGSECGFFSGGVFAPTVTGFNPGSVTLVPGVYYIWVLRAGHAPVLASATITPNIVVAETTATAGQINVPASPTVTTHQITPLSFSVANFTFTANVTSGSNVITPTLGSATLGSGPFFGATLNGTGIAGLTVSGITTGPSGKITAIQMSGNASATNSGVTVTATGVLEANVQWPYIAKTN